MEPRVVVLDAVGDVAPHTSVGMCLAQFLRVASFDARLGFIPTVGHLVAEIWKDFSTGSNPTHAVLIAHSNRLGFGLPSGETVKWSDLSRVLGARLPSVNILMLCGCDAGYEETARTILSSAPSLLAVYGPQALVRPRDAVYAYLSLYYHIGVRGRSIEEAVKEANKDTAVNLTRWSRA